MKKLLYLFSASLLVLTSCSKDDDNSSTNATTTVLPTKVLYTETNGSVYTSVLTYNGNKIVSVVDEGVKTTYTYTGDLITKEQETGTSSSNFSSTTDYSYENNKLKTAVTTETSGTQTYKSKYVYTHNSDGTVNYNEYNINVSTGAETLSSSGKYTFSNGNLVKKEEGTTVRIYEYDTKNNPVKNILGFDKLLNEEFSLNNIVKETSTYNGGNPNVTTYQYDYNTNGYPTEQRIFYNGTADGKTQYNY